MIHGFLFSRLFLCPEIGTLPRTVGGELCGVFRVSRFGDREEGQRNWLAGLRIVIGASSSFRPMMIAGILMGVCTSSHAPKLEASQTTTQPR